MSKSQKKIGVSIRGGAAKALGAIGLVRYFQENNIQPFVLGGSSMGAIIAVLFSLGIKWDKMAELLTHVHLRNFLSLKGILKQGTLLSEEKFKKKVLEYTGSINIEELPLKTVIFATDPILGERVFLKHGLLIDAIMASCAYPVLMNPVKIGEKNLVDGDFFPSYSANEFRDIGADTVVGVGSDFTSHISDLDLGIIEKMGATYNTLMKNYERNLDKKDPVDILVKYDSDDIPRFNFEKAKKLINRVYDKINNDRLLLDLA